jgi:oligosaccharide repeat unit polymerase
MNTIAYTVDLVPDQRSFDGGASYFYAMLTALPNVFGGELHPAIARGLAETWLTETINPIEAKLGGSLGYSFIAEAYLNFGWLGAPIAIGIMGFLFVKLILWGFKPNELAKMATLASFLSFVLFFPRSESVAMVRPFLWYSAFPFIIISLLNSRYFKFRRTTY